MPVRESQVEDVLATYPQITQKVLGMEEELTLLARQKNLESGRLDLLFAAQNKLLLLELKVEDFKQEFIQQVKRYRDDLFALQRDGLLLSGTVEPFLLCPAFPDDGMRLCEQESVIPIEYSPSQVLEEFFIRLRASSPFITLKPIDSGLWHIYLINRVLYSLATSNDLEEVAAEAQLSVHTVRNHLRFAEQLCLVERVSEKFVLSKLGVQYVVSRDQYHPVDALSEEQAALIRDFIVRAPFASPTIFGIYQIIETVFNLARNTYPVPLDIVLPHFRDASGKRFEWQTKKSIYHGTRMYSNYAIELGLLAKMGDKLLITPSGIQFILMLQLHKGLQVIDALRQG